MSLILLAFILVFYFAGVMGSILSGGYLGWMSNIFGFYLGVKFILILLICMDYYEETRVFPNPLLPICRNNKCTGNKYTFYYRFPNSEYVCTCGDHFIYSWHQFLYKKGDGTLETYMKWNNHDKKWEEDKT